MIKRLIDVVSATCGLLLLSPLMVLIVIAVALESKGHVLFRQTRVGRYNRHFTIYKFRTMHMNTPDVPTDLLQSPQAYITRVGALLRKSSLDELPQLYNILRGDMTLVGPRPALYNQDRLIELRTRRDVHLVRPGLTGWAQINGRDELGDDAKVKLDDYYCKHRTLLLDLYILLRTFGVVSTAKGIRT